MVDALTPAAASFYEHRDSVQVPGIPDRQILPIKDILRFLEEHEPAQARRAGIGSCSATTGTTTSYSRCLARNKTITSTTAAARSASNESR